MASAAEGTRLCDAGALTSNKSYTRNRASSGTNAGPMTSNNEDYRSEEGDSGGDEEGDAIHRSNQRWDPLDEERLLAWKKEGKSWKWVFDQFPTRTEGAIRVRWHLLQKKKQELKD